MSGAVLSNWYSMDGETITHWCGGVEDSKKGNKPKETQVEMTKWFNPAPLDEETKARKCSACGAEWQTGEPLTVLGS